MTIVKHFVSKILILTQAFLLLTSCASIIHGTRQKIAVSTNPPGASVSDGMNTVNAPAMLSLNRDNDYILTISKPGYEVETVRITHVIDGTVAANLLLGPWCLVGWGVDAISGAQWRLDPETISVNLRPLSAEEYEKSNKTSVETLETKLQDLESLKQKGLITEPEYKAIREVTIRSFESKESIP